MIDSRDFLEYVSGYGGSGTSAPKSSAERPPKLGTIDAAYTTGLPKILFDGETMVSAKGYSWLDPYLPLPGDRVSLLPVGQSYLILGKINTPATPAANYVEIASTQTVPNATVLGPATPAFHARSNAGTAMCHWSTNDTMMFDQAGVYTISYSSTIVGSGATGRSFIGFNMNYDTRPIARASFGIGEDTATASATVGILAGEEVIFNLYQTSGATRSMDHRIRITRVSNF
jgi:hypothetical protein